MPKLVVALDFGSKEETLLFCEKLQDRVSWVKVGLELYSAEGPKIISDLHKMGFKIFVDLKFFDIPNTVRGAVRSILRAGADMINIHSLGGEAMANAALLGREDAKRNDALILAVTVLTSMEKIDFPFSIKEDTKELVVSLAENTHKWGLDGVVCSALEVPLIKEKTSKDFLCLCPGIRPQGANVNDQKRIVTVSEAKKLCADYMVIGRPLTKADNVIFALDNIYKELE